MAPKLRVPKKNLRSYAEDYSYSQEDNKLVKELRPAIKARGHMALDDLEKLAKWKSPRSSRHVSANCETYVEEITRFAFHTRSERARIESLTCLSGVGWPTASAILHFFHKDRYPILDFRALWSVSLEEPWSYSFDFWWQYVVFCRKLAKELRVDMRLLDKALWQYSKDNQTT